MRAGFSRSGEDERGFTLIELLVVMIIIGILAAIAVPLFLTQRTKAHEAAAKSDASNVAKQVATFFVDGTPTSLSAGTLPVTGPAVVTLTATTAGSSDTADVKIGLGDVFTKLNYDPLTGSYCVEITPADVASSPWKALPDGIVKGTCP